MNTPTTVSGGLARKRRASREAARAPAVDWDSLGVEFMSSSDVAIVNIEIPHNVDDVNTII
jgi:hypothetical protein